MKKIDFRLVLAFLLVSILYWWLGLSLLTEKPSVWPDEAIYAEVVENFWSEGRLGSDLWRGLIPGVGRMVGWNPPVYLLMLSGWMGVFGFGIVQMRWLALFLGFLTLMGVVGLSWILGNKKKWWWPLLVMLGLVVDFEYMRGVRLARPEVLVVALVYWGQLVMLWGLRQKKKQLMWWVLVSGLLFGLAVLSHPLAVSFWVSGVLILWWWERKGFWSLVKIYGIGLGLPIVVWLGWIWGEWGNVWSQMVLAGGRKGVELTWVLQAWNGDNWVFKWIIGLLVVSGLLVVKKGWDSDEREGKYLAVMVGVVSLVVVMGKQFWYVVFLLPLLYLGLVKLMENKLVKLVLILLVGMNGLYAGLDWLRIKSLGLNYGEFSRAVVELIEEDGSVFLSAIPDPYFGFVEMGRQNKLVEFPVYEMSLEKYGEVLGGVDVVVYTKDQSRVLFGDFFDEYLRLNTSEVKKVKAGGYEALVFELKDQKDRVSVTEK